MTVEAERAFRQAFALWPESASKSFPAEMTAAAQFIGFLRNHQRAAEAELVEAFSKRFPEARGFVLTVDR